MSLLSHSYRLMLAQSQHADHVTVPRTNLRYC